MCKVVIPLVVGVGLFYWLYNNVDVEQMKNILRYDVDYTWIGVMLVISTFSHVFRAMRWRLQLRALGIDAPLGVLVVSIFGTYAVNLVFHASERCGAAATSRVARKPRLPKW